MSSPKVRTSARRARPVAKKAARSHKAATATPAISDAAMSSDARRLAGEIQRALASGEIEKLSQESLQDLMAALCRTYTARVEAGQQILPLRGRTSVSSTDVMTTASGLLKSANLAVFELGMWQSWTGR